MKSDLNYRLDDLTRGNHIDLYNLLYSAVLQETLPEGSLRCAQMLEDALESSGALYGWKPIPLAGEPQIDTLIHRINQHFTG